VLLSGDVHFPYVLYIRIRHRERGPPHILARITSSGLEKTPSPDTLLDWFASFNRWP